MIQPFLHSAETFRALFHLLSSLLPLAVLDRLVQPAERIKDKAVQLSEPVSELHSLACSPASIKKRDHCTHCSISRQSEQRRQRRKVSDEQDHHKGGEYCNGDR